MRVWNDVHVRWCDECQADTNHDTEYRLHSRDYAEETIRCHTCGHSESLTYTGDDI